MQKITTFFMFEGQAEEAMNFYISLFDNASVKDIRRYGPEGPGKDGTIMKATFILDGQEFICIDSNIHHGFTFTASMSLFVNCNTEAEIDKLFANLSEGGLIMMPLNKYPFSNKFAWVADKYGVSWQLNLVA